MRAWLVGTILLTSAVAGVLTELILRRVHTPPDAEAALLGSVWVAMPYMAAVVLAVLVRRSTSALVVLLVTLLLAAAVGVFLFDAATTELANARQQAAAAVLPGEDPHHGPAAMRQSGADLAVAGLEATCIFLAVFVPPVQLAVIGLPAGVVAAVSYWRRRRAEARRLWEIEHTDTRDPDD